MIKIDFSTAIALFLFFNMALVMVLWVIYNCNSKSDSGIQSAQNFRQCPYCCFVYLNYQVASFQTCPQCKSLIEEVRS